jgi:predicted RNA binding protein YcfA (HicA-like mRNA interferase family)
MMSPMNTKDMVELHNRDLERLVEPRGWQVARRQASASWRRRRIARGARSN